VNLKDVKKNAQVRIVNGAYKGSQGRVVRYDLDIVVIEFPDTRNKPSRVKVIPEWIEPVEGEGSSVQA
jgi:hypothetical protein